MQSLWITMFAAYGIASILIGCSATPRATQAPAGSTASPAAAASHDTIQAFNAAQVQAVLASIAGRENEAAGRVFQNVKLLGDVPARTLVAIMNGGYARALGVTCAHCHVVGDFASDAKRPKRAAREMAVMHRAINQQLARMEEIATPKTDNRAINCMTCHRGMVDPRRSP
jgi:hypothetical protein